MHTKTSWWNEHFYLDLRSLGLARIAISFFVLVDLLFCRLPEFNLLYQPDGLFPVAEASKFWILHSQMILEDVGNYAFSAYYWIQSYWYAAFVFALTVVSAACLGIGYKTKFFALLTWFLIVSLQNRMPFTLNPGDYVVRLVLLGFIFIPVGNVFSLDFKKNRINREHNLSPRASGWGVFQFWVFVMLFFVIVSVGKLTLSWFDGTAVYYVMTSRFGMFHSFWVAENMYPLTVAFTYFAIAGELLLPLLILVPTKKKILRVVGIFAYCSLLIGMYSLLELSLVSFLSCSVLLAFLPNEFWEGLTKLKKWKNTNFCKHLNKFSDQTVQVYEGTRKFQWFFIKPIILVVCLSFMWTEINRLHFYITRGKDLLLPYPEPVEILTKQILRTENYYSMFGWNLARLPRFYIEGVAQNKKFPNKTVDVFSGKKLPPSGFVFNATDAELNSFRLRRVNYFLFGSVWSREFPDLADKYRARLAQQLCAKWEFESEGDFIEFRRMEIPAYAPGEGRPQYKAVNSYNYSCAVDSISKQKNSVAH